MEYNQLQPIIEKFAQIATKLNDLELLLLDRPSKTRSSNLNELSSALAKAQGEMNIANLNNENPYFKSPYADMESVVNASRPALTKHGLSVIQQILPNDDGQNILHTILTHDSGQWIESRMRILPSKPDVQSLASYIEKIKRTSYEALIGVISRGSDDDGEMDVATSREVFAKGTALNTKYNPREQSYETITKEQLEELEYELADYTDVCQDVLDTLKIQSLIDMPKTKYSVAIRRIREIKNLREGNK